MARRRAIAECYADALFQAAISENAVEEVLADCHKLQLLLREDEDFSYLIQHQRISKKQFDAAFLQIQEDANALHKITSQFMCALLEKERQRLLPNILAFFESKIKQHQNKKDIYITVARPLNQAQRDRLISVLEKRTGKQVFLEEKVDPALIGGLIIRIDSFEIDSSVRAKLHYVQQSLESLK